MSSITAMKVVTDLTSKAIFYYSLTGNTKSLLQQLDNLDDWEVYDLNDMAPEEVRFEEYETILFGTLTIGRGTPPSYFKKLYPELIKVSHAKIGLFGSGQSHYGDAFFCGGLDVLEDLLKQRNKICFKLKFESYPTPFVIEEFNRLVKELLLSNELIEV